MMKEQTLDVATKDAGTRIDRWLTERLSIPRNQVKQLLDNGKVLVNDRRVLIAGWELESNDRVTVRMPEGGRAEEAALVSAEDAPKSARRPLGSHARLDTEKVRRSALRHIGKPTLSYQKECALAEEARRAPEPRRGHESRRGGRKGEGGAAKEFSEDTRFLKVYFNDKHLIVVEKPANVLSVPQHGSDLPDLMRMVQSYLRRKFPQSKYSYLKPLHRLDAETSGVMVFALSKEGEKLEQQFRSHTIGRRYMAVVHGAIEKSDGVIEAALEKGDFGRGRKARIASGGEGKSARTAFTVKERYAHATLVEARVLTGRTHQIRVHFASKGHPVVGDKTYAEQHAVKLSFPRQALHAAYISFRHPSSGKAFAFTSPMPDDMKKLVDKLRS